MTRAAPLLALLALAAAPLAAQQDSAQAAAPADEAPAAPVRRTNVRRANWLDDQQPLQLGTVLTVVIDEQMRANENVSQVATNDRSQTNRLNPSGSNPLGPQMNFGASSSAQSRDDGRAGRGGDLTAVITVRVTGFDEVGNATVEGKKTVNVDGRKQEVQLTGTVRPMDVAWNNLVSSERVLDAEITYKGAKIGPRQGILGKILNILWP
ncbi:MAG: flagellar basal body L-ring protein FlgH [Gemmatimonadales bacterium]|nr:flagellar basal body L-ring protein FlgH [Gemmatimonadales bacterium]